MIERLKKLLLSNNYNRMTPTEIASVLNVPSEEFKKLMKAINQLEEECFLHISKQGYIFLASKLNIFLGEIKNVKRYYAICKVFKGNEEIEIEIPFEKLNHAYTKDLVKIQMTSNQSGQVLEIIKRNLWEIICEYRHHKFIHNYKNFYYNIRLNYRDNQYHLVDGQVLLLQIKRYEEDTVFCEIKKIIGHRNDPGIDVLSEIIASGVPYEFDKKLLDECEDLLKHGRLELEKRMNLTQELIVTIDGEDAKDLDDAISLSILENGNYYLGVHIADVSHYVKENSLLDKEAFLRGTSIYLANGVIPMLPHALSNGICSLFENELRLTISCFMEIDYQGNVVNYDIQPSYIRSKARLNYHDVNCLFNHETCDYIFSDELKQMLFMMKTLSSILSNKMKNNGYLELDIDEAKLVMDADNNKVIDILKRIQGPAEKMIENFMITANETVASHIYYQQLPFIYRIHAAPTIEKMATLNAFFEDFGIYLKNRKKLFDAKELQAILNEFKGTEQENLVSQMILRSLSKAVYSVENIGHFGLGSKVYTHFTSPIRRYPDLIVHRYLKKYHFLHEYNLDQNLQQLLVIAEQSSYCERRAVALERDIEDIKKAEYMENYIGAKYEGIISGIMEYGVFVRLENTCEGFMRYDTLPNYNLLDPGYIDKKFKLGTKINVELISTSKKNGEINFAYYGKIKIKNHKGDKENGSNYR